ncbi:cation-transporting P-type ATPase [Erwinia psidii]|uniref:cation-transporting P-type ATPase n=1 Tax=Erwinia psidii TaxID=69224 RepID=UPI00226B0160|nr:cation-transporting P-type ATPase [Erwinia psidii]MCX8960546.1 cation-transporting P-type ATPase [Erwinia psidii]
MSQLPPTDAKQTAWYRYSHAAVLKKLNSTPSGLSATQAQERLASLGPNQLPQRPGKNALIRFLAHFNDVLIYVLLAAAVLTGIMGHWVDTAVILGVALINSLIGFIQENNAEKSLKSIGNMLPTQSLAMRDKQIHTLDARELVPGDIVMLRAGDRIPADLRLIEAHNLQVEEAILTGESTAIIKQTAAIDSEVMLGDRNNLVFSGTTVSAGSASGVVIATGGDTELGQINHIMTDINPMRTPLLVQMDKLGHVIFLSILAMMGVLFIFSLLQGSMPMDQLLLSLIGLAVAAVPEGLPAIISIILSLGVQAMVRKRAIIRKLPTVETLGAMTVVCSDKTGTLTMNEMTVKAVLLAGGNLRVEGNSYRPEGRFLTEDGLRAVEPASQPLLWQFLRVADLCNDSTLVQDEQGHWNITGGPTAGALKVLAVKGQLPAQTVQLKDKLPFDSAWKYMATHHRIAGEEQILMTGAPDMLLTLCQLQLTGQGNAPLDRQYWEEQIARYAREGLRMVACAFKYVDETQPPLDHHALQQGMIFCGIAAMMDPPRPEAVQAIAECHQAGIRVKMITGDHQETAMAIGKMLGIGDGRNAVTGYQLEHMTDGELANAALRYDIFARTSPQHKLRLVKALQDKGEVVGMTGDGVNDAPALKQADVGIAMGIKGTEVTKEAADMILTDDNFATIANAVKEGRRVWDNLKKTILFIMPTNLAQGLLIVIAMLMGNLLPLTPVQILWMNMATSATLSFGIAFEKADKNVMRRAPRDAKRHVMDRYALWRVGFVGFLIAISAFMLEAWLQPRGYSAEFIRTVLLQTLVTAQWVYMLNCRETERFSLNRGLLRNRGIWVVTLVLILLQLAIICLPLMNTLFGTVPLPLSWWLISLAVGTVLFLIVELEKQLTRSWRKA